jgi:hypothetical protein
MDSTLCLKSAIEQWLYAPGPSPEGGLQLETLGWLVVSDCLIYEEPLLYRWTIKIHDDCISTSFHGDHLIVYAADPEFFNKLSKLMLHIINCYSCDDCKHDIWKLWGK